MSIRLLLVGALALLLATGAAKPSYSARIGRVCSDGNIEASPCFLREPAWPGLRYVVRLEGFNDGPVRVIDDVTYEPTSFGVPLPEGAPVGEYASIEYTVTEKYYEIQAWGIGTHRFRFYQGRSNKAKAVTHLFVSPHHAWYEMSCWWYQPVPDPLGFSTCVQ